MTQQVGFSVLTAPLAAIDRRALSQAWYSALHLAHDRASELPAQMKSSLTHAAIVPKTPEPQGIHARARSAEMTTRNNGSAERPRRSDVWAALDRRARRSTLARKIEQTFLNPSGNVRRATFWIDGTQARVHVTLQTSKGRARLVAVCPPAVRASVAQALAQARYALSARGIDLTIETADSAACM